MALSLVAFLKPRRPHSSPWWDQAGTTGGEGGAGGGLGLAAAAAAHARSWPRTHFHLGQETLAKFGFLKHFSKLTSVLLIGLNPRAVRDAARFLSPLPSPLCCALCALGCPRWRPVPSPCGPRQSALPTWPSMPALCSWSRGPGTRFTETKPSVTCAGW